MPLPDKNPTAEDALAVLQAMNKVEKERLCKMLDTLSNPLMEVGWIVMPKDISDAMVNTVATVTDLYKKGVGMVGKLDKKLTQRNRKSAPETIRRNVEICDLRKQNKNKWSLARLAGKYHVTKRAIQKILAGEDKWRQLIGELANE